MFKALNPYLYVENRKKVPLRSVKYNPWKRKMIKIVFVIIQIYFQVSVCFSRVFVDVKINLTNWETGKLNIKITKNNLVSQ